MKDLPTIFESTNGRCHLCKKRLASCNYGKSGKRGAWEIDHSKARANGGTDHGNNLRPACISCNRSKQAKHSRVVRMANGLARAPFSMRRRAEEAKKRGIFGIVAGGITGFRAAGPVGAIVGGIAGFVIGSEWEADD